MTHRLHSSPPRATIAGLAALLCLLALPLARSVAAAAPATAATVATATAPVAAATTATTSVPAASTGTAGAASTAAAPVNSTAAVTTDSTVGALAPASSAAAPAPAAAPAAPATVLPRALTPVATPIVSETGSSPTSGLLTMVVGLGIVLAVMLGIAWVLKRSGVTRLQGNAAARVIGGVSVGTRERVVIVEVADQWIVIGVAPGRVNHLTTLPRADSDPLIDTPLAASNFSAWLKQTLEKRNANR